MDVDAPPSPLDALGQRCADQAPQNLPPPALQAAAAPPPRPTTALQAALHIAHECDWRCSVQHLFGNSYRCERSGQLHICDARCEKMVPQDRYSLICQLSRRVVPLPQQQQQQQQQHLALPGGGALARKRSSSSCCGGDDGAGAGDYHYSSSGNGGAAKRAASGALLPLVVAAAGAAGGGDVDMMS